MKTANSLLAKFEHHELNQITHDQNTHVDALACLASAINSEIKRTIEVGFIPEPSIGTLGGSSGQCHRIWTELDGSHCCIPVFRTAPRHYNKSNLW
ncbi:unnamed protein product [Camellia sinensis]